MSTGDLDFPRGRGYIRAGPPGRTMPPGPGGHGSHPTLAQEGTMNRILNCKPSRDTHRDWTFAHARSAGVLTARAALPRTVDLRAPWWKVGDQLATGSCVGWALADSVLRWHFTGAGKLDQKELLSPQVHLDGGEGDRSVRDPADDVHRDRGDQPEGRARHRPQVRRGPDDVLPFRSGRSCTRTKHQRSTPSPRSSRSPATSTSGRTSNNGAPGWPRTGRSSRGSTSTRPGTMRRRRQGNLDVYHPATVRGGHAVSLVGYTESGSSCATAGGPPPGATRASAMHRMRTPKRRSTKRTA